jgi:cell division septum initiation protein DivIVA
MPEGNGHGRIASALADSLATLAADTLNKDLDALVAKQRAAEQNIHGLQTRIRELQDWADSQQQTLAERETKSKAEAERTIANANRDAAVILEQAQAKADRLVAEAQQEVDVLVANHVDRALDLQRRRSPKGL